MIGTNRIVVTAIETAHALLKQQIRVLRMPFGMFLSVFCLLALTGLTWQCQDKKITQCPCGKSGNNVTICSELRLELNECENFQHCETCSDYSSQCRSCPHGKSGSHCTEDSSLTEQKKGERYKRQSGGWCPYLKNPKHGSSRCLWTRYGKKCTGQCLAGYNFGDSDVVEITLQCKDGQWHPFNEFPQCVLTQNRYAEYCWCHNGGTCDATTGTCRCPYAYSGQFCEKEKSFCYDPGKIENGDMRVVGWWGIVQNQMYLEGCSVQYKCHPGFTLRGASRLTCLKGGTWSAKAPSCEVVSNTAITATKAENSMCNSPGKIENGEMQVVGWWKGYQSEMYKEGCSVEYKCHPGFTLRGVSQLTCLKGGSWSAKVPSCEKDTISNIAMSATKVETEPRTSVCLDPGYIINGERWNVDGSSATSTRQFTEGSSLVFSCKKDFALVGQSLITCLPTEMWSEQLPQCERIRTTVAPTPTTMPPTTTIPLTTMPPTTTTTSTTVARAATRTSTTRAPAMTTATSNAYCREQGSIQNGVRFDLSGRYNFHWIDKNSPNRLYTYPEGMRIQHFCKPGFRLVGEQTITCLRTRHWSNNKPLCRPVKRLGDLHVAYCKDPGFVSNSNRTIIYNINDRLRTKFVDNGNVSMPEGIEVSYRCPIGFTLSGKSSITCLSTGKWSDPPPECLSGPGTNVYCQDQGPIQNGRRLEVGGAYNLLRYDAYWPNRTYPFPAGVQFEHFCRDGYTLVGERTITCLDTGHWSYTKPLCRPEKRTGDLSVAYCNDPGLVPNSNRTIIYTINDKLRTKFADSGNVRVPEGAEIHYRCNNGLEHLGKISITCLSTGTWSDPLPECRSVASADNALFITTATSQ